ncbi:hypothetical protein NDU88_009367 [Pleurodeles waltl]|uniref:Uncharacterized protein n=1 Tax=Pleurodeles waltl TaxID=8319 RepID=A0AAV7PT33_PLEWA|nr:hypothetical protein NDU88_009367 [Pleurodeles waltl]
MPRAAGLLPVRGPGERRTQAVGEVVLPAHAGEVPEVEREVKERAVSHAGTWRWGRTEAGIAWRLGEKERRAELILSSSIRRFTAAGDPPQCVRLTAQAWREITVCIIKQHALPGGSIARTPAGCIPPLLPSAPAVTGLQAEEEQRSAACAAPAQGDSVTGGVL